MLSRFFCVLLFSWGAVFGDEWVFSIKDSVYSVQSMYDFYGFSSWDRGSKEEKP
jgi:hypothetical protein